MASNTKPRDPERIYLEPWPYSPEGRLWCEDAVWPLDGDGPGGVEYVRADLHAAEIARLTRDLEEARRERSAARAEVLTAQASLRRVERVLEEARERERALREVLVEVAIPLEAFWMVMHDSKLLSAEMREAVQKAIGIVRRTVGATTVREGEE